jgi:hypothetical protein
MSAVLPTNIYASIVRPMIKREKLDPFWHKARVAARIWMKAEQGKPLSPRQKRFARMLAGDPEVTNQLIHDALQPLEVEMVARAWAERRHLSYEPPWLREAPRRAETSSSRYGDRK